MYTWFWWVNLQERDHLENLGKQRQDITEVDLKETGWQSVGGIYLAQNRCKG